MMKKHLISRLEKSYQIFQHKYWVYQKSVNWDSSGYSLMSTTFSIYIYDITNKLSLGSMIRLFADDSLVYRIIKSPEDVKILKKGLDSYITKMSTLIKLLLRQILHLLSFKEILIIAIEIYDPLTLLTF